VTARDPSKTQGELALVRGCISKESSAWREMISKYGALVAHAARTTLHRVLKGVDPNAVEEASQAIWAMLVEDDCRRLRSFDQCRLSSARPTTM